MSTFSTIDTNNIPKFNVTAPIKKLKISHGTCLSKLKVMNLHQVDIPEGSTIYVLNFSELVNSYTCIGLDWTD